MEQPLNNCSLWREGGMPVVGIKDLYYPVEWRRKDQAALRKCAHACP